jgi:hypothetical protein
VEFVEVVVLVDVELKVLVDRKGRLELNGTNEGALSWVTRPKPVRAIGFPYLGNFILVNWQKSGSGEIQNVQQAGITIPLDPVHALLNSLVEGIGAYRS